MNAPYHAFAGARPLPALAAMRQAHAGRVQLIDHRRRVLLMAQLRVLTVGAGFALLAAVALLRMAYIGVVQPAPAAQTMEQALLPPRGEITDRNGVPLARA